MAEKQIVMEGAIMHPKVANDITRQGEMQVRALRKDAEKKGEYIPYNKCCFDIFTKNPDNHLNCYNARVDMGDGNQNSLLDYLSKECPRDSSMVADFEKATREKGAKEKIIYNEFPEIPEEKEEKETAENLEMWESEIQNERDKERGNDIRDKEQVKEREPEVKENR